MRLIFKVKKASKDGKSPVEIVVNDDRLVARDTDKIISTLDKLLKRNRIKVESLKRGDIKIEINPKAGLTSQRITKAIIKALSLSL
ncbi:hypothetical protein ES703_94595 [subsurface metagenome]